MKDKEDSTTIDWVGDLTAVEHLTAKRLSNPEQKALHRLLLERKPTGTSPELAIALNHITNVTLQDLLAEYND